MFIKKCTIITLILLILATGCQLTTANYLRDEAFPEDPTTKILLFPFLLPPYLILSVVDIVGVNPVRGATHVPDVTSAIWEWNNDSPWLGYGLLLPVKAVAIPGGAIGTVMFAEQFVYSDDAP